MLKKFAQLPLVIAALGALALVAALAILIPDARAQDAPDDTIEIVGQIDSAGAESIQVNGLTLWLDAAEVTTPLTVGAAVRVEGALLSDGSIQARQIDAVDTGLQPGEFQALGVLDQWDTETMVIAGVPFDITGADIEAGLTPGDHVLVHAHLADDETLTAREVQRVTVAAEPAAGGDALPDTTALDSNALINERCTVCHSRDRIDNASKMPAEWAATVDRMIGYGAQLDADERAAVLAYLTGGAADSAASDAITAPPAGEIEVIGTLESHGADSVTVGGQTIDTTDAEIDGTLVLGALVKVHAHHVDGALVAREIAHAHAHHLAGPDHAPATGTTDDHGGDRLDDDDHNGADHDDDDHDDDDHDDSRGRGRGRGGDDDREDDD